MHDWSRARRGYPVPTMNSTELTCRELVELVTEYVEGALAPADSERFEAHLSGCEGCTNYLRQMRKTVEVLGELREQDLEPDARDALLVAFRRFRRADSPR
jgi:anti-sigma factor RsiW